MFGFGKKKEEPPKKQINLGETVDRVILFKLTLARKQRSRNQT